MLGNVRRTLLAGVAVVGAAVPALAADIAVVIDNSDASAGRTDLLIEVLNAQGFEVYDRRDAARGAMQEVLTRVAGRQDETERLILIYFGEARSAAGNTWLLPSGFEGTTTVDAAFGALDLDTLLAMAAPLPGRSAVVLGASAGEAGGGPLALATGIGAIDAPQGVLVVSGPVDAVGEALQSRLLADDTTVEAALAEAGDEIDVHGFVSPDAGLVRSDATQALRMNEPAPVPKPPSDPAEANEAALDLDQDGRREVQEYLTVLGHNTRGIDGVFGPGTRGAIESWQQARELMATGFLTAEQLALLRAEADARGAELAAAAEKARREEEAADAAFWRTTGAKGAAADLRAYLERYPDGLYARQARESLARLEEQSRANAGAEDRAAWDAARGADNRRAYRAYIEANPDGAFAEQAQVRIDALGERSKRDKADKAAAAAEDQLGLNQGSRSLIEGQLAALGYDVGDTDGGFDGDTRRALREFQTRQGLNVSGYVDGATVRALIVASLGAR